MNTNHCFGCIMAFALLLGGVMGGQAAATNTPEGKTLEAGKTPVQIAKAGKALGPIVISPESSEAVTKTAAELAGYLKRITGAEFAIEQGREAKGITLGTLAQFPDAGLKEPMAIKEVYDGLEAFAIRSDDGHIRLLGNTDPGVEHAAYRFLELLGCRWFFQGDTWNIVPSLPDLAFNLNETGRPDIWSRNIWFGRTKQKWEKGDPDANAAFDSWAKGNRMGMSLKFNVSHNWHAIPTAFKDDGSPYKKEFDVHPEYFALIAGRRTPPQFCVTNAGLQKLVIQYANRYFEKNPDADMVSLDPADGPDTCECPECAKLGHPSAQPFYLANIVAKEIQKTHPGKMVGLLAYSSHSDSPPFQLEPNVYIQLTAGLNTSKFTFDELFEAWTKKCAHMGIYEYYSYWEMDKSLLPGSGVQNNLDALGPRMRNFVANHVASISGQAANNWGVNGLGYYLAAKLMWDASSDTKALRRDFYEKAFGPAAVPMERYYERLNLANKPLAGASLIRQCLDDLEEAAPLAEGRPDVLARLAALKENLVYNAIGLKVGTAKDMTEEKERTLEWFTWAYRTRNNYMNDWITFRSTVGRPAAEKFDEKSWFWRNTNENPWRKDEPVTPQELEARLREAKADLGELPATPELKFRDRFVLMKTDRTGGGNTKQAFSGKAIHLLASTTGEPLRFHITTDETHIQLGEGVVGVTVTRDMTIETPDASYTLSTSDGKEIARGKVPVGEQDLELKVPGPGVYRFTCNRGGAGWKVEFPKELPNALLFERGEACSPVATTPAWFYVPKGTVEIVMYTASSKVSIVRGPDNQIVKDTVSPTGPVVRGPDNRVAYKGASDGRFVSIKVKPGEDGKVWSISGRLEDLWFRNVPTVLSSSPETIFVPEDLAKRDGLKNLNP